MGVPGRRFGRVMAHRLGFHGQNHCTEWAGSRSELVHEQGGSPTLSFMNFGAHRYVRADRREFNVSAESGARQIARPGSTDLQRGLDDMPRVHSTRTRHPDTMPTDKPNQPRVFHSQRHPTDKLASETVSRSPLTPRVRIQRWERSPDTQPESCRAPSCSTQSSAPARGIVNRTS